MENNEFKKMVERITFDQFRIMAKEKNLSAHEKIGFPDNYRDETHTDIIFEDIRHKILAFPNCAERVIADIGCGCDLLASKMIHYCESNKHQLYLFDSKEMLEQLEGGAMVHKIAGRFPDDIEEVKKNQVQFDSILVYSVMQHILLEANPFTFIDRATLLLKPGGKLLLGDIPNRSKRKRFFASPDGIKTHQAYTHSQEMPQVDFLSLDVEQFDDSLVFAILQRYRLAGMETYLLPQAEGCPMATRREDILIVKPH